MAQNIDNEILEIQMLQNNLLKELQAYNEDLKAGREHPYLYCFPNKHKASFNRLRLELNNKYVGLSKKFKGDK